MRLGFDGLFALVQSRLLADPLSGHLFIFRNRTADRLKVLYWGGHGLCLWCQRLEQGMRPPNHVLDASDSFERSPALLEVFRCPKSSMLRPLTAPLDPVPPHATSGGI